MTRALPAIVSLLAFGGCGPPATPEGTCGPAEATVRRVIDGDTVELSSGDRLRYLLVDAPELDKGECFAAEAATYNTRMLADRRIRIEDDRVCRDDYGRRLGYVSVEGREVNGELIARGYACVLQIPPNGADRVVRYREAESRARAERRGLWAVCDHSPCGRVAR